MSRPQALERLKTEVDKPTYSGMTAAQVLDALSVKDQPGVASLDDLRTYMLMERKGLMFLYGRVELVAQSAVGDDPIGESTPLTLEHICAAKTMLNILNPTSGFALDYADSRFDALLNDLAGGGCKAIGPADKTAIQALSLNRMSLSEKLQLNEVLDEGSILYVRSLS